MKRSWKTLAVASAVTLAVAAGSVFAYFQLVKAGVLRYNRYDRRQVGTLAVGGVAPNLALTMYDGSPVRLAELWTAKPVFIVFGSCT